MHLPPASNEATVPHRRPAALSMSSEISPQELHDYVDGHLAEADRARIARYLASHPQQAAEAESYRAQIAGMHALYDDIADEPVPDAMLRLVRGSQAPTHRRGALVAGLALLVLASGIGGWWLKAAFPGDGRVLDGFVAQAQQAHLLYAGEALWASDLAVGPGAATTRLLSERLGVPVALPGFERTGFALRAVRLVPAPGSEAATLLYRDGRGRSASLLVARLDLDDRAPRRVTAGGVTTILCIRQHVGYALTLDGPAMDAGLETALGGEPR